MERCIVGTLPGIDTQGSYSAATRYSTSRFPVRQPLDNLYTRTAIHSFEAQQSTALKPHARDTWEQNCSYPGSV